MANFCNFQHFSNLSRLLPKNSNVTLEIEQWWTGSTFTVHNESFCPGACWGCLGHLSGFRVLSACEISLGRAVLGHCEVHRTIWWLWGEVEGFSPVVGFTRAVREALICMAAFGGRAARHSNSTRLGSYKGDTTAGRVIAYDTPCHAVPAPCTAICMSRPTGFDKTDLTLGLTKHEKKYCIFSN